MTIRFKCPCGHGLEALEVQAGQRMTCPACGRLLTVPAAAAPAAPAPAPPLAPPVVGAGGKADEVKAVVNRFRSQIIDGHVHFTPDIPAKKLRSALGSYANGAVDEEPLVLVDNTVFGGGKDGALLTSRRLHAHNIMESANVIDLSEIKTIIFIEGMTSTLHVNDHKFLETNLPEKPAMRAFAEMLRAIIEVFHGGGGGKSAVEALKNLKELLDAGIITEQEFNARKQKHLDQL